MKTLHVLRSAPDETTNTLIKVLSGEGAKTYKLYEGEVDWEDFIDQVFSHEKVICWW